MVTATLLLFCTIIHQDLDAGFHISSVQQGIQGWRTAKKRALSEDNFILRILLRFSSVEEHAQAIVFR